MGAQVAWWLAEAELEDVLGYRGVNTFRFQPGLTVIEAPNHTGKTSFALGVLWGLTGLVPRLARVNKTTFRLTNRHAGAEAGPRVRLRLATGEGRTLELERHYVARAKPDEHLTLVIDGDDFEGAAASERLALELELSGTSLEGVGVVLQDQRHALITGGEVELGNVVNEVLGLEVLGELVPVLAAAKRSAGSIEREALRFLQGDDPVRRWEAEERRIADAFRRAEKRAFQAGYAPAHLEDPVALGRSELEEVASELGRETDLDVSDLRRALEELREDLRAQRGHSPLSRRADDLAAQRRRIEGARRAWESEVRRLAELEEGAAASQDESEAAATEIAKAREALATCAERRSELETEEQFLQVAYEHLRAHPEDEHCPLCEQPALRSDLVAELRKRLAERLVRELEQLAERESEARKCLSSARDRAARGAAWERAVERFALDLEARLVEAESQDCTALARVLAEPNVVREPALRAELGTLLEALRARAAEQEARAVADEGRARSLWQRQEAEVFQPIERKLERVRERLVPLVEAAERIEDHGRLRETVERRADELGRIVQASSALAADLDAIARAVADEESEHASEAVARSEPFLSSFFAKVAGNPDYTGLSITTSVVRGKVTYRLRASSDKSPHLDGAAGHVLSEGDLSAASIALLLALATGATHRVGFLVLDDPAQGMDARLTRALARELAAFEDRPQTLVLTHQEDFAAALAEHGAERQRLDSWTGGRARLVVEPNQGEAR